MKKTFDIAHSKKECPIYDISCPYCDSNGYCHIRNPMRECDDYFAYMEYSLRCLEEEKEKISQEC